VAAAATSALPDAPRDSSPEVRAALSSLVRLLARSAANDAFRAATSATPTGTRVSEEDAQ
jgi:hypothetical protein